MRTQHSTSNNPTIQKARQTTGEPYISSIPNGALRSKPAGGESPAGFFCTLKEALQIKTGSLTYSPSREVLNHLGISKLRFSRIYNKTSVPTFPEVVAICNYFNFSIQQLSPLNKEELKVTMNRLEKKYGK